jgi:hypothetical protein
MESSSSAVPLRRFQVGVNHPGHVLANYEARVTTYKIEEAAPRDGNFSLAPRNVESLVQGKPVSARRRNQHAGGVCPRRRVRSRKSLRTFFKRRGLAAQVREDFAGEME